MQIRPKRGLLLLCLLFLSYGLYALVIHQFNGKPQIMSEPQLLLHTQTCQQQNLDAVVSADAFVEIEASVNTDAPVNTEATDDITQPSTVQSLDDNGLLNVAVWNIYKQNRPNWHTQLDNLLQHNHLVLLQEAKLNSAFSSFIKPSGYHGMMAKAFNVVNTPFGVLNLSATAPSSACAYHSVEPIIRFAKATLITTYPLSNGQSLLVANLHGINFDLKLNRYRHQINQAFEQIAQHQGPVIFAGDFNSWRKGRLSIIEQLAHQHQLVEVNFNHDVRTHVFGMPLDHIFYRDMKLNHSKSTATKASDHTPIVASFSLIENISNQ